MTDQQLPPLTRKTAWGAIVPNRGAIALDLLRQHKETEPRGTDMVAQAIVQALLEVAEAVRESV